MQTLSFIGAKTPKIVLYLDNRPHLERAGDVQVPQLIATNGNHWRKILTIYAKLCSGDNWREYRDSELLNTEQQICFSDQRVDTAGIHIFSGKSCWQRFGVTADALSKMQQSNCGRVYFQYSTQWGLCLYTPYFDYRQFPNILIEQVKEILKETDKISSK
ncbi:MAG: hypothetical protein MJK10_02190 [Pseudomonadales bacterium]|nr:hypothetical protein [Pseudomonadales bacterium]NRA14677.1 hypothetical protein [Oceanospirillaceae bacterium]